MIKNIVLDFGGVILTDDDAGFLFENKELLDKYPTSQDVLEQIWDRHWRDVGESRLTIIDFYNELQKDLAGQFDPSFSRRLFEAYKDKTSTLPLYSVLPQISKSHDLYALTNIFKEGLDFKKNKFNLGNYFKFIVASCDVGMSKPDPKIFEHLIDKASIDVKKSVFIDDREKNTIVAKQLGFNVIRHETFESTISQLKDLGILNG